MAEEYDAHVDEIEARQRQIRDDLRQRYGSAVTNDEIARAVQAEVPAGQDPWAVASPTGRRSGKAQPQGFSPQFSPQSSPQLGIGRRPFSFDPRELREHLRRLKRSGVVVWTSNGKFTYAAIYGAGRWYITGRGQFYNGNEFTEDQFLEVLCHPEVTAIWFSRKFDQFYGD